MDNRMHRSIHHRYYLWSISKRLLQGVLIVSLLFGRPISGHTQSNDGEAIVQSNHLFLPLVASDQTGALAEEPDTSAPTDADLPADFALDEDAVLNAPLPDEVQAASVNSIFTVTKVADTNDGVCNNDCSLREAVSAAAADPTTYDRVVLPAGTYSLTLGTLSMSNSELIGDNSATTIIDGGLNADGSGDPVDIITIAPIAGDEANNQIKRVTLRNGRFGVLHMEGTLTLANVKVLHHRFAAVESFKSNYGDAKALYIFNSIIEKGREGVDADAVNTYIENTIISDSTFRGVFMHHGVLTVVNSTFLRNQYAGILLVYGSSGYIRHSASIYNQYSGIGLIASSALIEQSTISRNTSLGFGGGLHLTEASKVTLDFVTITNNTTADSPPSLDGGGIWMDDSANSLIMRNSILANNMDVDGSAPDCAGTIISGGYNLIKNVSGCTIIGDTTGNVIGKDPKLGGLTYPPNGTAYRLPSASSPVIDAIPTAQCPQVMLDQRYVTRPRDGNGDGIKRCDIGAIER